MGIISSLAKKLKHQILNRLRKKHIGLSNGNYELKGGNEIVNSEIGENTYISHNSIVFSARIGKFCSIGPSVIIGYGDHPTNFLSTSPKIYFKEIFENGKNADYKVFDWNSEVSIGNDVWIGAQCYIKNGISIGDGAIIGAGSIVLKDIPPYSIAVGSPAKVIKFRFSENMITELLNLKWWSYEKDKLKMIEQYLSTPLTPELIMKIKDILQG